MSTPADNTRFKAKSAISLRSKNTREEKQVIKASNHMSDVQKKNELVKKWLAKSHGINGDRPKSKLNQTEPPASVKSDSWAKYYNKYYVNTKGVKDADRSRSCVDSDKHSDVGMNLNLNLKKADWANEANGASSTVFSRASTNINTNVEEGEDTSIQLGQSAMSGRSSTARRRLERDSKLKQMANLHGAVEIQHVYRQGVSNSQSAYSTARDEQSASTKPYQHGNIENEISRSEPVVPSTEQKALTKAKPTSSNHQENEEEGDGHRNPQDEIPDGDEDGEVTLSRKLEEELDPDVLEKFKKRLDEQDSTVFYDMFELIITKLATVQSDINGVKIEQQSVCNRVSALERNYDVICQTVDDVDAEIDDVNDANVKLIQALIRTEDLYEITQKEIGKITSRLNKGSFIVNGLMITEDEDGECDVKKDVTNFLKHKMEVKKDVKILSAHKMGNGRAPPIWFSVKDTDDVPVIFKCASNLKGKKNSKGKKYLIRGYNSEQMKEEKLRQRDIIMENYRLPDSHRMDTDFVQGKLLVDGDVYSKEVREPTIRDSLLLNKEQEAALESLNFHVSDTKAENGSLFIAYAIEVQSTEQVSEAYQAVRQKHISATHVMGAHRIFGSKFHLLQDHMDNGEWGSGRIILDAIKSCKVWNIAIFIVRYHNGPNLGPRRFTIIADLVKNSIATFPRSLNYGQLFADQDSLKHLSNAAVRPLPKRVIDNNKSTPRSRQTGGRNGRRGRGGRIPPRDTANR